MENQKDMIAGTIKGELTYDDKVIQKIVSVALDSVDGLLSLDGGFFSNVAGKLVNTNDMTSGVNVEVGKKQVAVDLDIVAEYGKNITDLYDEVKQIVSTEVNRMTDLDVIEVNVNVVDVKTKEQHEKDSETVQDKVTSAAETTGSFASKQTDKAKQALNKTASRVQENNEPRVQ